MNLAPHHRRRAAVLASVLAVAGVLYWGDSSRAAKLTPQGQPGLVWLKAENAGAFGAAFNRDAERETRVVLFLSPT